MGGSTFNHCIFVPTVEKNILTYNFLDLRSKSPQRGGGQNPQNPFFHEK